MLKIKAKIPTLATESVSVSVRGNTNVNINIKNPHQLLHLRFTTGIMG